MSSFIYTINHSETYILPDTDVSEIKQEFADGEGVEKYVDYKLQPSCSKTTETVRGGKTSHECNICGKSFTRKPHLMKHLETVHEGTRAHVCTVCDKSFGESGNLKHHISTVYEGKTAHL